MCISYIGGDAGYQSPTSRHPPLPPHLRLPTNFLSHKFLRSPSYTLALMSPTSAKSRWSSIHGGDWSHIGGEVGYQSPTSKRPPLCPHLSLPTNFLSHEFLWSPSCMIALMSPTSAKSRWASIHMSDWSLSAYNPLAPYLNQVQVALSPKEWLISIRL
mgnify:CR=1 FL=1